MQVYQFKCICRCQSGKLFAIQRLEPVAIDEALDAAEPADKGTNESREEKAPDGEAR